MSDALPYDVTHLSGGAVRVLIAPFSNSVPVYLSDIILPNSPYTAQTGWVDLGATAGATAISRAIEIGAYQIQQETTDVLEEVTAAIRSIAVPVAEMRPDILAMIEEGITSSVTGAGNVPALQKTVFGSVPDLTAYRVAMIARRQRSQGEVTEHTTLKKRGRFLAWVGYKALLTADTTTISFEKGNLATGTITMKLYPEPTITTEREQYGFWLDEPVGTVAA